MQMLRMTLSTWLFKRFYQILFLSISLDFYSILVIFRADFIFNLLFLFFFEQYLIFLFGTGTRDWYRGSSVLSWFIRAFVHVLFKNFYQILFLSIFFDFLSIFDHFGADFIFFMLFLFFFEQYLVSFFGTGTRDRYRGPSVLSWSIWAFMHVLTYEP